MSAVPDWVSDLNLILAGSGTEIHTGVRTFAERAPDTQDRFGMRRALVLPCTYAFYNQIADRPLNGMEFSVICGEPDICGAARVECEPSEGRFHIGHVFVDPQHRRSGVGRQLMRACVTLHSAMRERYTDVVWADAEMDAASPGGAALLRVLRAHTDPVHDLSA